MRVGRRSAPLSTCGTPGKIADQSSSRFCVWVSFPIVGYGLDPIMPVQSTLLNRAGGTRSASEKSKPAVTFAQYAALCLGLMFGPGANAQPAYLIHLARATASSS